MNVVTSADAGFFHCTEGLAKSVRTFYDKKLIVYDLGLTPSQRSTLDAELINIDLNVDWYNYTRFKNVPFVRTTHKPFCVKHYFSNCSEPIIFVDADCLFMERVEESGFDVGVTLKPRRRLDFTNSYNGILNAGVIFFNDAATVLVDRWIEDCRKPDTTDQKALTDILSESIDWQEYDRVYDWHGLRIKVFRVEEYNDYYLRSGRIFHFKGKRHEEQMYAKLVEAMGAGTDPYRLFRDSTGAKDNIFKKFLAKLIQR
jgi:hypothetical protein